MANEYLKRTPTSTGNRRVFTWSGWVKLNNNPGSLLFTTSPTKDNVNLLRVTSGGQVEFFDRQGSDASTEQVRYTPLLRDYGSWTHILINADTTQIDAANRVRAFVNGVELSRDATNTLLNNSAAVDTPPRNQEFWRLNGSGYAHYIGAFLDNSLNTTDKTQYTDIFFIDGQALTPDVFGFYKQGKGYISVGSTQATDFRPGQWVPKTPRVIKTEINRRGGFGVNGFYLPMNDSKNFGADFHCDPNSIITLNEKLPQPRVGVATTASVGLGYTDALRADPYAANLVLAIPGISTSTAPNLITNGTFDTSTAGWTAVQATISAVNGNLRIVPNSGVNGGVYQSITTEVGKRYTVFMEVIAAAASWARLHVGTSTNIDSADKYTYTNGTSAQNVGVGRYTVSFTPTTTTTIIWLEVGGGVQTQIDFDNVIVRQEDVPKDYSAFIKGSGTNKTITASGNAGIGYNIPSYYGSALTFDGSGDYFDTGYSIDGTFGSGNYTIECWINSLDDQNERGIFGSIANQYAISLRQFGSYAAQGYQTLSAYFGQSATGYLAATTVRIQDQWNHVAMVKNGITGTLYLNGVSVGIATNVTAPSFTTSNLHIGAYYSSSYAFKGYIQDFRVYNTAKYKGGFDVPRPYTPVGIATWRAVPDTTANNFATLNPLAERQAEKGTITAGNLRYDGTLNQRPEITSTIGVSTGKWYYEIYTGTVGAGGDSHFLGICNRSANSNGTTITIPTSNVTGTRPTIGISNRFSTQLAFYDQDNFYDISGTSGWWADGSVVGFAFDINNNSVSVYKNGVLGFTSTVSLSYVATGIGTTIGQGAWSPWLSLESSASRTPASNWVMNFGQNPTFSGNTTAGTFTDSNGKGLFKYQPPSGFLALCEDNLPTPAISDPGKHFKTVLYTGDGNNGRSIVGVGFTPDLIWLKNRSATNFHVLCDSVRGPGNLLFSNSTQQEDNYSGGTILSFNSDGYSVNHNTNANSVNISGGNIVAWCWRAGAGTTSTNTDGTIPSVVSVNQDAGFSIVSYTGNGSSPTTVGHGLTKAPKFIIFKCRNAAVNWFVYHGSMGPSGIFEGLNTTSAYSPSAAAVFNNTAPSSSVITLGGVDSNTNGRTYIAYCWAEIEGFSKFGSYVGNGSADGPFVYCGFKPAWLLVKRSDGITSWIIMDNARTSSNPVNVWLNPDQSVIDQTTTEFYDFTSNGFKLRYSGANNASGGTYIFAAFAESPFQTANSK